MKRLSRNLRKYMILFSAVLLMVLFSSFSVLAASVSETENGGSTVAGEEESTEEDEILEILQNTVLKVEPEVCTYNGEPQTPAVKLVFIEPGTKEETEITDRFVIAETEYSNNTNAGTANVSVMITGYYKINEDGSFVLNDKKEKVEAPFTDSVTPVEKEASFTINPVSVEKASLTFQASSYTYNGKAIEPTVTKVTVGDRTLTEGTDKDYTVSYKSNTNAGEKISVTVKGTGNYTGSLTKTFTIEAQSIEKKASVTLKTTSYTYDGAAKKPAVSKVMVGDVTLKASDYTVSYKNNTNAGNATVTVTGKGNYKGSATAAFTIKPATISSKTAKLALSKTSYTYTGSAIKPGTTVTVGKTTLKKNTDYTVSYKSNTNAGTKATVTIKGTGNYTGSLSQTFTIKAKSISSATVSLSTSKYAYNGKDRKPGATVKIKLSSTVTLKNKTDYTVSYSSNCKSIGTKTVTIKGKGNYTGTVKKTYTVVPEKATGLKVSKRTTSSLTVKCTAAKTSGCKYQFRLMQYNSSKEKWEDVTSKKTSSNSATFSGLSAGRSYKTSVRIYKTADSKTYTGDYSSAMYTITTPAKPVASSAVKTASKTMKVTWKAVNSATGYEIQYSTKSDFSSNTKSVKVTGRTTTSKSIKLSSTSTYYARVRAYRTYHDNTYYGAWSSKVSTAWSNVYASYSTTYSTSNKNRSTNLRLACNAINGTILANGATFSFNGIVGERTAAKGYKEAIIYEGGRETGGIGGGICQVATTIFNAALKANFQIVERYQHSLTVHYVPLGYDAAIAWGSKNLRFKNNSGTSIKVQASASGGTLSIKFLTSDSSKPPKVTTKVTVRNRVYTLKRYVNGKCNYTTTSKYLDK